MTSAQPFETAQPPSGAPSEEAAATGAELAAQRRPPRRRFGNDGAVEGLPQRPKAAEAPPQLGVATRLLANYFPFRISPNCQVYQYAVDFDPPLEASRLRTRVVYARKELGAVVYDGTAVFAPRLLPEQRWTADLGDDKQATTATLRLVREWKAVDEAPFQLCGMLLRRLFRELKLVVMGRAQFDPSRRVPLPQHRLEIWPGIVASVVPSQMGTTHLTCDYLTKAVRLDTVLEAIRGAMARAGRGGNWRALSEADVNGTTVVTRYNNQTYRVDRIDWKMTPADTFLWEGHGQTSFAEYVLRVYDKKVTDMRQPMLVTTRRQRTNYLIPEFCCRTGITDSMSRDHSIMADLDEHTRLEPQRRVAEFTTAVVHIANNQACRSELAQWGMHLTPTAQECPATVLPTPSLGFRGSVVPAVADFKGEKRADWTLASTRSKVFNGGPFISTWAVMYLGTDAKNAQKSATELVQMARSIGLNLGAPTPCPVPSPNFSAYLQVLKTVTARKPRPQLLLIFLHTDSRELYNAIKSQIAAEPIIPTQLVRMKLLLTKRYHIEAILLKVAMQICCKIGGELWTLQQPPPETRDSMLIGIDVCHSTSFGKSVAGLVATTNATFSRYHTSVAFQPCGQEIISTLSDFVASAIAEYRKKNGRTPKNVFVYRDGVGDGQLEFLLREEIPQIKEGFARVAESAPNLVFIVVKKRIRTRLFAFGSTPTAFVNPTAGTVCDSTITHAGWYDFFLISQSITQGTVAPTHYHVIEDAVGMRPQALQNFTFQLCHMYYNWTGTIRVPAPCQYAHKLAFHIGQNVQHQPHESLANTFYFL